VGAGTCETCPARSFCGVNATIEPSACPIAYYCPSSISAPTLCPNGTYGAVCVGVCVCMCVSLFLVCILCVSAFVRAYVTIYVYACVCE
jgi:hypothetical protein